MEIIGASEFLELNLSLEGTEIKIVNGFFNSVAIQNYF